MPDERRESTESDSALFRRTSLASMNSSAFPAFVKSLPEADLPFEGLRGWLLECPSGQVLFNESDVEVTVPEHSHGDQWGVVIDGEIDLRIGHHAQTYVRGDTYFIPAGTPHQARIYPGYRAIDYFADRGRYRGRALRE
ncbi:MAG: cupin domain-containing protein [Acidobacteria bacterium]|nr:cupin domain-containing protein [Acidobacteriota bacterium]